MAVSDYWKLLVDNKVLASTTMISSNAGVQLSLNNLKDPDPKAVTRLDAVENVQITFDFSSAIPINALGWKHSNMRDGATVQIRHSTDNFVGNDTLVATVTQHRPGVVQAGVEYYLVHHHLFDPAVNRQYVRFVLNDPGNPDGFLTLGVAFIGLSVDLLTDRDVDMEWSDVPIDESAVTRTPSGAQLVERVPVFHEQTFRFSTILGSDVYQTFKDIFDQIGSSVHVWSIPHPNGTSQEKFRSARYGLLPQLPRTTNRFTRSMNIYRADDIILRESV